MTEARTPRMYVCAKCGIVRPASQLVHSRHTNKRYCGPSYTCEKKEGQWAPANTAA